MPSPESFAHPICFTTEFSTPIGRLSSSFATQSLLRPDASDARLRSDDEVRGHVRDMLRQGGFKPTGRSKPASEYLAKAASERGLSVINAVVDACNAVSLHSGLPISVVDHAKVVGAWAIALAPAGSKYVFNASGQEIDVDSLLCLIDLEGPCANAVKDAQRTKTTSETTSTLTIVWGYSLDTDRARRTADWLKELMVDTGGRPRDVQLP